jgi:hypothetical protein
MQVFKGRLPVRYGWPPPSELEVCKWKWRQVAALSGGAGLRQPFLDLQFTEVYRMHLQIHGAHGQPQEMHSRCTGVQACSPAEWRGRPQTRR